MLLKNKTAVITGCNRGIGLSILELFSENGANIIACVRKYDLEFENKIKKITKKYKNKIDIFYFNLENEDEIEKAFSSIKDLNVKIDILVNNAGINQVSLFQMTSLEKYLLKFYLHLVFLLSL